MKEYSRRSMVDGNMRGGFRFMICNERGLVDEEDLGEVEREYSISSL